MTVLIDLVAHIGAHVRDHLAGKAVAGVVHGQHNAMNSEARVEGAANLLDRGQELRQALKREEFALQRDNDGVGGSERVDGEKVERRRTIDQHIGHPFRIIRA